MTSLVRTLTIVLSALALLWATPANAATHAVSDGKDDVFVYDWITDEADWGWWDPDISSLRISHTTNRVIAVAKFHRLGKYPWDDFAVWLNTDADKAVEYRLEIGDSGNAVYRGKYGFRELCGVTSKVNFARDTVRLSAPRSCVGNPAAVSGKAEFWTSWGPDCCEDWAHDDTGWTAKVRRG